MRVARLRSVHLAARDPAAGASNLLGSNAVTRAFVCEFRRPASRDLEFVVAGLVAGHRV
jgi:hypothetical protein